MIDPKEIDLELTSMRNASNLYQTLYRRGVGMIKLATVDGLLLDYQSV